jgi:large subunit ribosomal protein L15
MGTTLHSLSPNAGATKKPKRVGRGRASGTGKTSGRGMKGQKARSGHHMAAPGFEGGQMPMIKRLPKRGFKNPFRTEAHAINVATLSDRFEAGAVDVDMLRSAGLLPKSANIVKILGHGDISKALNIKAHRFSKSAIAKIEAAGGTAEVVPWKSVKAPVEGETSTAA